MTGIEEIGSEQQFQRSIAGDTPVLVDFWASWCGPCRMIAPVLEELAQELAGRIRIAKVDVDQHPEIATRQFVQGIPTLILFQGGTVLDRIVGALPKAVLRQRLLGRAA